MSPRNRDLAVRLATAFVLLPIVIVCIWLGGLALALLVAVAAGGCALELNALPSQLPPPPPKDESLRAVVASELEELEEEGALLTGAALASIAGAAALPLVAHFSPGWIDAGGVLLAVSVVAFVDALSFETDLPRAPQRVSLAVLGAVYPGLGLMALVELRDLPHGAWWILLALVATWWNDTGAYFAGRAFGRHKLYPRMSPSKTWEGAAGGTLASVIGSILVQLLWLPEVPTWAAAAIGLGASILGPLGDLSESMLKRAYGVKDSGRLLPGHGGLLDRVDALLFTGPFVLLCARFLTGHT